MNLLHIDSSITGDKSVSRRLTAEIVDRLTAGNPDLRITRYDLDSAPFEFLSSAAFADAAEQATGEKAIADFQAADILVVGAPMYNFSVPAQLKAWIDRIAVAGKTFRYTANGPEGLSGGKRVFVVSTRGGVYSGDLSPMDHQESYLRTVFGFLGIDDVTFIRAEGVNISPENAEKAIDAAQVEIRDLAA